MNPGGIAALIVVSIAVVLLAFIFSKHRSHPARAELTASKEYRVLADEFRRLSDLAITAQEHTDLRLTDVSVQLSDLREKLESMQRILSDVELLRPAFNRP
jgi:hypothetical protein